MPPKPKFTREEVIAAALEIAAEKGMEGLTSREIGAALKSSARPVFTVFKSMEELCGEVRRAAMERFEEYAKKAEGYTPVFKQIGLQMIMFAQEQPKLFRLLFMSENAHAVSFGEMFGNLGDTAVVCINAIMNDYGLDEENAMLLFKHLWIYTYGVGTLTASGVCSFTRQEISDMLSREFVGLLTLIKSGKANSCTTETVKDTEKSSENNRS